jgi:hypothetical protein
MLQQSMIEFSGEVKDLIRNSTGEYRHRLLQPMDGQMANCRRPSKGIILRDEIFRKRSREFTCTQASLEEVNQMWSGLGYYRRAKLLHEGMSV